jgi:hypothetical protein
MSSRMGCLLDALDRGYRVLGLDEAAGGDGVFRQLVLARIIEPASKTGSQEMVAGADRTAATPVRPLGLDERHRLRIRMRRAE